MTHVLDALGAGQKSELNQVCIGMLDVATKVGSDEAVRELDAEFAFRYSSALTHYRDRIVFWV